MCVSGATVTLYVDGMAAGHTTTTSTNIMTGSTLPSTCGSAKLCVADSGFRGMLDDIMIFREALAETEVKALAKPSLWSVRERKGKVPPLCSSRMH